ncbi:MAG: hypothetical protein EXS39_00665 [Opitutaceae bacterium]|nr:hypothetical protein [Opitutaceae bacterium]
MSPRPKDQARVTAAAKIKRLNLKIPAARHRAEAARFRAQAAKGDFKSARKVFKRAKKLAKDARKKLKALKKALLLATLAAQEPPMPKSRARKPSKVRVSRRAVTPRPEKRPGEAVFPAIVPEPITTTEFPTAKTPEGKPGVPPLTSSTQSNRPAEPPALS